MNFSEMGLKPGLFKGILEMGYKKATPIQEQVIGFAMKGENIVGQSNTGTGKTAAFLIPLLQSIDTNKKGLQALILAPTRELVNQIFDEVVALTKFYRVNAVAVYGGASPVPQQRNLAKGPSIIVATPGRLMDFVGQKVVNLGVVNYFVLDEVDRMLDMGFVRDIKKIRAQMPMIKQTYTFSATLSDEIKKIINEHIKKYEFIKVGEEVTVEAIDHSVMIVEHEHKVANVRKLIDEHLGDKVIIFTQTKRNTKTIGDVLTREGIKVGMLNGNMSQSKRMSTLKEFKAGTTKILITTDVAARGLNMDNVGLVINFDVPNEPESYIHRIGRTGRAGASGKAIMLVSDLEKKLLTQIERAHKITIKHSSHKPVSDDKGVYRGVKLDRSTDKRGGKMGGPRGGSPMRGGQGGRSMQRPDRGSGGMFGGGRPGARSGRPSGGRSFAPRAEQGEEGTMNKRFTRSIGAKSYRGKSSGGARSGGEHGSGAAAHSRPARAEGPRHDRTGGSFRGKSAGKSGFGGRGRAGGFGKGKSNAAR